MNKLKQKLNQIIKKIDIFTKNKYMIMTFIIFLMIQPILDIYILFTDETINIFKFSPSTIIRMVMIFGFFILLLFSERNKKHFKYIALWGILTIIYTIVHLYNCINISENINPNYRVSVISEIFYIIRMMLPLFVIYISFNYKMNFKKLSLIIVTVVLLFSLTIIFTNLTKLSLKSYSEKHEKITQNVIDWIFNKEEIVLMEESLSKGIFTGGNQLGNLLIMLLPITLYIAIKNTNFINCFTIFVQIFSCILIGTRIASLLWLPIIICLIIMMIFFSKIKKELIINKYIWIIFLAVIIFNGYILYNSPIFSRKIDYSDSVAKVQAENNTQEKLTNFNELSQSTSDNSDLYKMKEDFLLNNYTQFDIQSVFLNDIYNYQYDIDFWINIVNSPYETYNNSRKMQFLIAQRLFDLNNNPLDKIAGIGFSTTRNGHLYTEQDFYAHYYTIGISGSLLLIYSQLAILLFCIIKVIINLKNNLTFENLVYIMSLLLIFIIALISAHVLDELIVTIFIGFLLGQLLHNTTISTAKED